jgi:hypothetical protein
MSRVEGPTHFVACRCASIYQRGHTALPWQKEEWARHKGSCFKEMSMPELSALMLAQVRFFLAAVGPRL